MGAPVKFFKKTSSSGFLPSTLEGGGIYFIPYDGIYTAQGDTAGQTYPGNEYRCYANYTAGRILAKSPYYAPLEIQFGVIVYYNGSNYADSDVKSTGIYVTTDVAHGKIYSTPMVVKNTSGSTVLAVYRSVGTQDTDVYTEGWSSATDLSTSVRIQGTVKFYSLTCV